MSGGGGGGRQIPMASNRGQQMQNPQMGQQMGVGQGGTSMMTNPNMGGQIAPMQVGQQVGGGFKGPRDMPALGLGPTQEQAQHFQDMMPYMQKDANGNPIYDAPPGGGPPTMGGIGALGGMNYTGGSRDFDESFGANRPRDNPALGLPKDDFTPRDYYPIRDYLPEGYDPSRGQEFNPRGMGYGGPPPPPGGGGMPQNYDPSRGQQFLPRDPNGNPIYGAPGGVGSGGQMPQRYDGVGDGTGPGGMGFGPRLGFNDFRKGDLPGKGMPPGYGPTKGPIDGRKLRDMMDIRTRRPMDDLPNALENNLPPSLKRPTQNRRG